MRILLTNDDGIDAPGLAALRQAADGAGEIVVVAPATEQSGCSHRTTTDLPMTLEERGDGRFALAGTPADCVRVGLNRYGGKIDLVLAGINSGGNLGVDVYHSGTVAAVREAVLHGVPGVAVSHYRNRSLDGDDWRRASDWTRAILEEVLAEGWEAGAFWNVNFPCLSPGGRSPERVRCELDHSPMSFAYRQEGGALHYAGEYHARPRADGRDIDVCFGGRIAMTLVRLGA
ncbi:MAG: 5'/3'-nucleotidase SurE [Acidobacteria bacterium]|nr:5'/3'-nucleotidase SurE [Acidobacteriota bacterium]